jgi:cytoskeletal protein CcmA (bactofilin family)
MTNQTNRKVAAILIILVAISIIPTLTLAYSYSYRNSNFNSHQSAHQSYTNTNTNTDYQLKYRAKATSDCKITGDVNGDGQISISDVISISRYLRGQSVACRAAADVNADSEINWADSRYLMNYLFGNGPAPIKPTKPTFVCRLHGDVNGDKRIDIADAISIMSVVNQGKEVNCPAAADINGDGATNVDDYRYLLTYLFSGGPAPTTVLRQETGAEFIRGDANSDGKINIADVVAISRYIHRASSINCLDAADVNDDGKVTNYDYRYLLNYLFRRGPLPKNPFPKKGVDPTPDSLACQSYQ